jgi:hypothetical protein
MEKLLVGIITIGSIAFGAWASQELIGNPYPGAILAFTIVFFAAKN